MFTKNRYNKYFNFKRIIDALIMKEKINDFFGFSKKKLLKCKTS